MAENISLLDKDSIKHIRLESGIDLAYREEGSGPESLVFIHGMGSNLKAWDKNIAELKKRYHCLAIDLPNYGGSTKGRYPFTTTFFSAVILEFLQAKGLKDPVLVGHSMGGQAVLRTLIEAPQAASYAILVAPAGLETFRPEEIQWLENNYSPEGIAKMSVQLVRKSTEINFFEFPEDAEFMVDDAWALREADHFRLYCEMIPKSVMGMVRDRVNPGIEKIKAKVLILFGKNDDLIPHPVLHKDWDTSELAATESSKIPQVQLRLFDQCGHFLQWEQAELFNQAVKDFLKSREVEIDEKND